MITEPAFFACLVKSNNIQFLYLGVHTTLDEACSSALIQMEKIPVYKKGSPVDIELWNNIPVRQVIGQMLTMPMVQQTTEEESLENTTIEEVQTQMGIRQLVKNGIKKMKKPVPPPAGVLKEYYDWKTENPHVSDEKFIKSRKNKST